MKYAIRVWLDGDRDKYEPDYVELRNRSHLDIQHRSYYFASHFNENCLFEAEEAERHREFIAKNNPQFTLDIEEIDDEDAFVRVLKGDKC